MKNLYEIHEMIRKLNDLNAAQLLLASKKLNFESPKDEFTLALALTILSIPEVTAEIINVAKNDLDKIDLNIVLRKTCQLRLETILPEYYSQVINFFSKIQPPKCEISFFEYYGDLSPTREKKLTQLPLDNDFSISQQPTMDFLDSLENKILEKQNLKFLIESKKLSSEELRAFKDKYRSKDLTLRTIHEMIIDGFTVSRMKDFTGTSGQILISSIARFKYKNKNLSIPILKSLSFEEAVVVFGPFYDQPLLRKRVKDLVLLEELNCQPFMDIHEAIHNTAFCHAAGSLRTSTERLAEYLKNKKIHYFVLKVLTVDDIKEYLHVDNYQFNLNRLALKSIIKNKIIFVINNRANPSLFDYLSDYLSYLNLSINDLKNYLKDPNFDINKINFNLEWNLVSKSDYFQAKSLAIPQSSNSLQDSKKRNYSEFSDPIQREDAGPSRKKMRYSECFFGNSSSIENLAVHNQNHSLKDNPGLVMNKKN